MARRFASLSPAGIHVPARWVGSKAPGEQPATSIVIINQPEWRMCSSFQNEAGIERRRAGRARSQLSAKQDPI
jgi:hypothetical protein